MTMCGRFTLRRRDLQAMRRELRAETGGSDILWSPRYNIAPTDQVPILVRRESGARDLDTMTWGIPRSRNGRMVRQINTRAETIGSRSSRCAVVADGFYEWAGDKGSARQPYFFHRPDDSLILMAGLWQWHQDQQGYSQTFVIVTTAANALMGPIHDRMPAVLDEGDSLSLWLNPTSELEDLRGLLNPVQDDVLEMRPASPLVNSVKNDGPELLLG
jgi:putative SOS response-associated peptidase YedK